MGIPPGHLRIQKNLCIHFSYLDCGKLDPDPSGDQQNTLHVVDSDWVQLPRGSLCSFPNCPVESFWDKKWWIALQFTLPRFGHPVNFDYDYLADACEKIPRTSIRDYVHDSMWPLAVFCLYVVRFRGKRSV